MSAYYNEIDPFAAAWLRELMTDGLIAPGLVDERSIEDVRPDELAGFTQCHFFAGIGVWSLALRRAGWPDDRPVWTGSCPCQPFSAAGQGGGFDDERHLWPAFHWLVAQCGPAIVLGEQVASKGADPWIDLVQADVEALGYAFGCQPFPAAGVGAPHIRDRAYWVADAMRNGAEHVARGRLGAQATTDGSDGGLSRERLRVGVEGSSCGLADMRGSGLPVGSIAEVGRGNLRGQGEAAPEDSIPDGLADTSGQDQGRRRVQGFGEGVKPSASTAVAKDLQFYWSPPDVIDAALEYGQVWSKRQYSGERPALRVLEPSCGDGRILDAIRERGYPALGVEYHPGRAAEARAKGHNVLVGNFLDQPAAPEFDRVVMNPPFYGRHYVKHVRHALGFLKPGGTLVSILPATAHYDHGELEGEWRDLPVGSFSAAGTNVPTGMLRITKRRMAA